jgi:phosphatidate cytidylyltransferase
MTDEQGNNIWKAIPRADGEDLDAPPSDPTEAVPMLDEPLLHFSSDDGLLPHWTEPPTGQMPAILADEPPKGDPSLAAWSGFGAQSPVWRDDRSAAASAPVETGFAYLDSGTRPGALDESPVEEDAFLDDFEPELPISPRVIEPTSTPFARDRKLSPPKIVPSRGGDKRVVKPVPPVPPSPAPGPAGARKPAEPRRAPQSARLAAAKPSQDGRNLPVATAVGLGLLLVFFFASKAGAGYVLGLVVVVLAFAAIEFYDTVRRQGYQPAQLLGILSVVGLPLAAYFRGTDGIVLVLFLSIVATLISYMVSGSLESNPLPNTAATWLGVGYIGLLGSFGGLILGQFQHGVHTIVALVVGTVAYDIGGLVFGSIGKHSLIEWISPNKTWEGLFGGFLAAFLAVFILGKYGHWTPWNVKAIHAAQLGLVVGVAAPLGDLAESMLKRSLGVKDFGNILPAHGGVLDRFDCYLFVLPAVYLLCRVLNVY